jgi:hypothetical protein
MIDFLRLLRLLTEYEVAFIIIGGVAAVIHGSSRLTQDLDIVYHCSASGITLSMVRSPLISLVYAPHIRVLPCYTRLTFL